MKAPYQVDLSDLKDVANQEASGIIDDLRNDAEVRYFLSMISVTEGNVIRDRKGRKALTASPVKKETAK